MQGSDKTEIKNNYINTSNTNPTSTTLRGIYVTSSQNNKVFCNEMVQVGEAMTFEGTCNSACIAPNYDKGIINNKMNSCYRGFVLSGSGVVQQQGDGTHPIDMVWVAGSFTGGYTYTLNTTNVQLNSKLFGAFPPTNHGTNTTNEEYKFSNGGLNNASGASIVSCPTTLLWEPGGNHQQGQNITYDVLLEEINKNSVQFSVYNAETKWQQLQFAYKEMKEKPDLLNNTELNSLYNANQNTAIGKLWEVENQIENGNYVAANAINNSVQDNNIPEANQKRFNTIHLKQYLFSGYTFTVTEMNDLYDIAKQCPLQGGNSVYQSRNLINLIEDRVVEFEDNCDDQDKMMQSGTNNSVNEPWVVLYPNPNDGFMTLAYHLETDAECIISDISGREVCRYNLEADASHTLISCNHLMNGTYIYKVISANKLIKADKFVVNK